MKYKDFIDWIDAHHKDGVSFYVVLKDHEGYSSRAVNEEHSITGVFYE